MSGRKEPSEIMTGTLHNVEIRMMNRVKERWGEVDEKCVSHTVCYGVKTVHWLISL